MGNVLLALFSFRIQVNFWSALIWLNLLSSLGRVYNATAYIEYHPGGVDELMKGAGKDATALFDEV